MQSGRYAPARRTQCWFESAAWTSLKEQFGGSRPGSSIFYQGGHFLLCDLGEPAGSFSAPGLFASALCGLCGLPRVSVPETPKVHFVFIFVSGGTEEDLEMQHAEPPDLT